MLNFILSFYFIYLFLVVIIISGTELEKDESLRTRRAYSESPNRLQVPSSLG